MSNNSGAGTKKANHTYKAPLIILALFLTSVSLRLHALDDTVRGGHVWLTAHTVLTLQIWMEEGISTHHFSPVYTYPGETNENMRSLASGFPDEEGNYYYVSFPPFSFILAFFVLKVFGITPSLFALQVLNLLIHLITTWFIYAIVCQFYRKKVLGQLFKPALVGSIIYLFAMHPLWCHVYIYFADTLIQAIWAAGLYVALRIFFQEKPLNGLLLSIMGVLLFLAVYTEWLGLFFSAVLFGITTLKAFSDKRYIWLMVVIAVASTSAFGLTLFQYSQINGFDAFIEASLNKYGERSGYDNNSWYFTQLNLQFIAKHYWRLYYPVLGIILFLYLVSVINKRKSGTVASLENAILLFSLMVIPILIHHMVFLGFTKVHDFAMLKSSIPFAILVAILFNKASFNNLPEQQKLLGGFSYFLIAVMLILSLISYYDFASFENNSVFEIAAEEIRRTAEPDEALYIVSARDKENYLMVFMATHRSIAPQVQMLTGKNMLGVKNPERAIDHMKAVGHKKGRIYTFDTAGRLVDHKPVVLP